MAEPVLIETRIRGGVWEGIVQAHPPTQSPQLEVYHREKVVSGATLASMPERPGFWLMRLPIPAALLSDGVQTFMLRLPDGNSIGHFTVTLGNDRGEDLRAELDLIRSELDLLKRAFRRHVTETGPRQA